MRKTRCSHWILKMTRQLDLPHAATQESGLLLGAQTAPMNGPPKAVAVVVAAAAGRAAGVGGPGCVCCCCIQPMLESVTVARVQHAV